MGRSLLKNVAVLAATAAGPLLVSGHQHCHFGARNPIVGFESEVDFCKNDDPDGFCCDTTEETDVQSRYAAAGDLDGDCEDLHKEVLCSVCGPFSGHLYEKITSKGLDGLTMTQDFCAKYVSACKSQMDFDSDYCDVHTLGGTDDYWSYPYTAVVDFNTEGMTKAFPKLDQSELPPWPMWMEMTPDGKYWWIGGITGKIFQVSANNPSGVDEEILDITPISSMSESGMIVSKEEGLLGFAIGPGFKGVDHPFYVSYTHYDPSLPGSDDEKGANRLSKFTYKGSASQTLASEEILITTPPKMSTIHQSGWVGFKPSAKNLNNDKDDLYWAVGDGGPPLDPNNFASDINYLLGNIIRITVPRGDSDDLYTIPSGNAKGVVCTYGHRNPFRCGFDRETDALYCGEVGQVKVEEVNLIECGNDYGWNRFEGDLCMSENEDNLGSCDDVNFGSYKKPYFQYCHPSYHATADSNKYTNGVDVCGDRSITGQAIIGGVVYRGQKYKDILEGKYLFQDFQTTAMHYVDADGEGGTMLKIPDGSANPPLVAFVEDLQGEVYVVEYKGDIYHLPCGDLCASTCLGAGAPPEYEAEGCYKDDKTSRVLAHKAPLCPEGQEAMSPDVCAAYCFGIPGATHFGLQYAQECYCGSTNPSSLTSANGQCTMKCEGNPEFTCGGYYNMELFTLGDAVQAVPSGSVYLGCYFDSTDRVMVKTLSTASMTAQLCADTCASTANNVFFGLQWGKECHCGGANIDPTALGTTSCPMDCAGGAGKCGGVYATSVYQYTDPGTGGGYVAEVLAGATYLGCYKDDAGDRAMTFKDKSGAMTAKTCAASCAGSKFFGMQYGTECWCGDGTVDRHGLGVCNKKCGGNEYACGGNFATTTYELTDVVQLLPEEVAGATYLGCYKDNAGDRTMTFKGRSDAMTAKTCATSCGGSKFFGMQYGTECWCGDEDRVDRHGAGACDFQCEGNEYACGGHFSTTTYQLTDVVELEPEVVSGATYLGCYNDKAGDRTMTLKGKNDAMTAKTCAASCAGSQYFGMQYGRECWCGDEGNVNRHGTDVCDFQCAGGEYACGGYFATTTYQLTDVVELEPEVVSGATYLDCYKDTRGDRVMIKEETRDDMTAKRCAATCEGRKYFGTQYSKECWCGDEGNLDRHGNGVCDRECGGNAYACGGSYAISAYQLADVVELEHEEISGATYLGCYKDTRDDRVMTKEETRDNMTAERCAATCEGKKYFGMQYSTECWCGDEGKVDRHGAGMCDFKCSGNEYACGGSYAITAYQLADVVELEHEEISGATYLGCYKDTRGDRVMTKEETRDNMTAQRCAATCKGRKYFGMQYSTECWCGDEGSVHRHGGGVCDFQCSGNEYACGGSYAITAYQLADVVELEPEEISGATYLGCYKDTGDDRLMVRKTKSNDMDAKTCLAACKGKKYFGMQYSTECWCGDEGNVGRHGVGACDMPCSGSDYACGGNYAVTAYEIEGSDPPTTSDDWTYDGCYHDDKDDRILTLADDDDLSKLSPQVCYEFCNSKSALYFGLQYGVQCWCGKASDDLDKHDSNRDPECDMECEGSDDTCGGHNTMDVYQITSPSNADYTEVGCYKDNAGSRMFSLEHSSFERNSAEVCYEFCSKDDEAAFFGLQYGKECWCGKSNDDYDENGTGRCDHECPGNPAESCGGHLEMTVYAMFN